MSYKNRTINQALRRYMQSDIAGFRNNVISKNINKTDMTQMPALDELYKGSGKEYAQLAFDIKNGKCKDCEKDKLKLTILEQAPLETSNFLANISDVLEAVDTEYYDPNNDFRFTLLKDKWSNAPYIGEDFVQEFTRNEDGSQDFILYGKKGTDAEKLLGPKGSEENLKLNSFTLKYLLDNDMELVSETPDINKDMKNMYGEINLFEPQFLNDDGSLKPDAKLDIKSYGKRNDKGGLVIETKEVSPGMVQDYFVFDTSVEGIIDKRISPYIDAYVAGLGSQESSLKAGWNVFVGAHVTKTQDEMLGENLNAEDYSLSYQTALTPEEYDKVRQGYKQYFIDNYLSDFAKPVPAGRKRVKRKTDNLAQ